MNTQSNLVDSIKYNIPLLILLGVTLFLIKSIYSKPVSSTVFITTIYLYVFASILVVTFLGQYFIGISSSISLWKLTIVYFILAFGGICLMFVNDNFYFRHLGLILLLLAIGMVFGVIFKEESPELIRNVGLLTAAIIGLLSYIVYNSSEASIYKMSNWQVNLAYMLCGLLCLNVCLILFGSSKTTFKIVNGLYSLVFIGFVLSDTSKLAIESKKFVGSNPYEINYPFE